MDTLGRIAFLQQVHSEHITTMAKEKLTTIARKEGMVTLPFDEEQFYSFVRGLLGRPQTIDKEFSKSFALTRNDVAHVHALITQRVAQQNSSRFVGLSARLFFSDDSSVTFSSIEDLNSYNEIKPVRVVTIFLSWSFLVTFADRESPEKQQIELTFGSYRGLQRHSLRYSRAFPRIQFMDDNIALSIQHSARSWGADIENMLTSYVESLARTESKLVTFLQRQEKYFSMGTVALYLTSAIGTIFFTCTRTAEHLRSRLAESLKDVPGSNDILWIKKHVEIMTDVQISEKLISKDIQMLLYGLSSMVLAVVAGIIISSLIPSPIGGFVLYSRKSEEEYAARLNEERQSLRNVIIAFIGAVCIGIISNYCYAFLTSP